MLDLLAQTFFQRALVAGVLVGVTCSFVGVYVLLRRIVFLGIVLAQIASAAVALALLVGWHPLPTALAASVASALAFSMIRWRGRAPLEGVLGAGYVLAAALGTVFVAKNPVGEARALQVLFGNILSVPPAELAALGLVALAIVALHLGFMKEFVLVSFDYETALAQGVRARLWNVLLHLSLAVTIAFAIRSAGVLVTFALLVVPAMGARLLTVGMPRLFIAAVAFGTLSVPVGLGAGFAFDVPTGPAISLTLAAVFALVLGAKRFATLARRSAVAVMVVSVLLLTPVERAAAGPERAVPATERVASGSEVERELKELRAAVSELQRIVTEQQRMIRELGAGSGAPSPPVVETPLAPATAAPPPAPGGGPGRSDEPMPTRDRGLPPWIALLPEVRVEGNLIGNYTFKKRRALERALHEEREGEEFFVRRDRLNIQEIELGLRSAIDPFARFEAFLVGRQDFGGDIDVGVEEIFVTSGAIPGRIELKTGKFRTGFGEFNNSAPEELPEVDPPNVIRNLFGREGEGWIDTGVVVTRRFALTDELSLMAWAAAFNGDNETAFHGGRAGVARRPAWFGRLEGFAELGPTTGLEGSIGFAEGRALDDLSRPTLRSRIFSSHLELQHRDPLLALYRGFTVLGEFFYTWRDRLRDDGDREVLGRFGLYTLAEAQIVRNWSLGARFDYSQLPTREEEGPSLRYETAGSLIVSYRPSRFLTLRAQYKHTDRNFAPTSDEILLQALFKIGFERPSPF